MAGYISELSYAGGTISDFIEIVVPAGTDVSAYSIVKYNTAGKGHCHLFAGRHRFDFRLRRCLFGGRKHRWLSGIEPEPSCCAG